MSRPAHALVFKSAAAEARYHSAYDAMMRAWPVPHESVRVPTRFGTTHVVASGPRDGPPLVLLHGAGESATSWFLNVGAWSGPFRTYAVDTLGDAGRSVMARKRALFSRRDYVEWLVAVLDGLGVDRAHLVGKSYGGWLAVNLALAAPERVGRVVLMAPASTFAPLNARFWTSMLLIGLVPTPRMMRGAWRHMSTRADPPGDGFVEQVMAVAHGCRPWMMFPTRFRDRELAALRPPVLYLAGEREAMFDPRRAVAKARRLVPGIEAELVPDAAHVLNMDQPERVNARVLAFLLDGRAAT